MHTHMLVHSHLVITEHCSDSLGLAKSNLRALLESCTRCCKHICPDSVVLYCVIPHYRSTVSASQQAHTNIHNLMAIAALKVNPVTFKNNVQQYNYWSSCKSFLITNQQNQSTTDKIMLHTHTHTVTHSCLAAFFQNNSGRPVPEGYTILDFLKQRWRCGSGTSQTIHKSFAPRSSTSPLVFLWAACSSCHPTNSIKARKMHLKWKTKYYYQRLLILIILTLNLRLLVCH